MFLRALDRQSELKPSEPTAATSDPVLPEQAREAVSFAPHTAGDRGEFTQMFGKLGSVGSSSEFSPSNSPAMANPERVEAAKPGIGPAGTPGPGEFTRIIIKDAGAAAKPVAKSAEEGPESNSSPIRPKGFSTPGGSDAASAETSFTQIFKQSVKATGGPAQSGQAPLPPERPRPLHASAPSSPAGGGFPTDRSDAGKQDLSITSLIESLSSPSNSSISQRAPEPAPYQADPIASYQPVAKPAPASQLESGGVTSFIQRLSEPIPAPKVQTPLPPPIPQNDPGPGDYTRIISSPVKPGASVTPVPTSPAQSPGPVFARPVVPVPPIPVQAAMQPALVAPALPAMPVQNAPAPAPYSPPVPALAPPAVAAPKGKLEALVPTLLVVNTFLLVVILVVMIFLIKAR
jgi:hypothetical protein